MLVKIKKSVILGNGTRYDEGEKVDLDLPMAKVLFLNKAAIPLENFSEETKGIGSSSTGNDYRRKSRSDLVILAKKRNIDTEGMTKLQIVKKLKEEDESSTDSNNDE